MAERSKVTRELRDRCDGAFWSSLAVDRIILRNAQTHSDA